MSILYYAPREDGQQLAWVAQSAFSLEETARRAGCFLRESYPEGFGILPQLPTEAIELSGDVVHGLSQ